MFPALPTQADGLFAQGSRIDGLHLAHSLAVHDVYLEVSLVDDQAPLDLQDALPHKGVGIRLADIRVPEPLQDATAEHAAPSMTCMIDGLRCTIGIDVVEVRTFGGIISCQQHGHLVPGISPDVIRQRLPCEMSRCLGTQVIAVGNLVQVHVLRDEVRELYRIATIAHHGLDVDKPSDIWQLWCI